MPHDLALQNRPLHEWTSRLLRLPNILVEPGEIFDREAREPNALIPILVVSVGLGLLLMAYSGPMVNIALSALPQDQRSGAEEAVRAMIEQNKWIGMALAPVYVAASALAVGLLVYAAGSITASGRRSVNPSLHSAVSISAYASSAILLKELITYGALRIVGFENIHYFWDLKPLPGLHYLVSDPDTHRVAFAVLERLNVFALLYAFILAYGMRRVFRTSRTASVLTAGMAILGGLFVTAALAWMKP